METNKPGIMIDRRKGRVTAALFVDQWRDDPRMRMLTITSVMIDSLMDYCEKLYESAYRSGYDAATNLDDQTHREPGQPTE